MDNNAGNDAGNDAGVIALITGITGQDGSYLAEMMLEKGYTTFGIMRYSSTFNSERIEHFFDNPNLFLRHGDITDHACMVHIFEEIKSRNPSKVYVFNLAAQSHVKVSFEVPLYTAQVDALGTLNILEAIRATNLTKIARFYQASTSELFGLVQEVPQSETTPFYPRSPYGVAKLYAYWIVKNYREAYGMYACNGILFNHCSERRGKTFVTRKITRAVARIHLGLQSKLKLGNLDAKRDWGYAPDYCRAMIMMLEQPFDQDSSFNTHNTHNNFPKDYVIGTGEYHSVREFVERAFKLIGIDVEWRGEGVNEIGVVANTNNIVVEVDPKYFRPAEVEELLADPTKAREELGWVPTTPLDEIINRMLNNDIKEEKAHLNE